MALERFTAGTFSGTRIASNNPPQTSFTCTSAHSTSEKISVSANVTMPANTTRMYIALWPNISGYGPSNPAYSWEVACGAGTSHITAVAAIKRNIPAGQFIIRFYGAGGGDGNATMTVANLRVVLGAAKVVAGNPIYKTDFDDVGQSATSGSAIANSNFTQYSTITASAWNTKWGL